MDALILSCGTGGGHNSAANALKEELALRGHSAVMMNPYDLKSQSLSRRVDNTYIKTVQRAPWAFGIIYAAGNAYRRLPINSPVQHLNHGMAKAMERYLSENRFDAVLMTHLFPAEIMTILKRRGVSLPKTVFVGTDYTCIPFSEETDCDAYIVPNGEVFTESVSRGIPENKLYPLGIPVAAAFSVPEDMQAAKARLGLPVNRDYILLSGGSMGAGSIETAIEASLLTLGDNERAIVICGSNRPLYERLRDKYGSSVILVGQTRDMAGYMRVSDVYLTKPGGLSSTEAAVLGIPILHLPPIPGCETKNARWFHDRGMSLACKPTVDSIAGALNALRDPQTRQNMLSAQKQYVSPTSAHDICDLTERLVSEKTV